jgi:hypothetical protein
MDCPGFLGFPRAVINSDDTRRFKVARFVICADLLGFPEGSRFVRDANFSLDRPCFWDKVRITN